jgi:predicted PhzF superfamily epimerase YddE/YHI9
VVACYPAGSPEAIEVRAFFRSGDATIEDPVTGSLNASIAQWLLDTGRVSAPYVASQARPSAGPGGCTSSARPTGRSGSAAVL